ncbi:MAG: hypothetical protein KAT32_01050 [Candidatus Moranbacteria bacterium]|nr:hypothetical protein [Candidatus Moranbacteria bacterium]
MRTDKQIWEEIKKKLGTNQLTLKIILFSGEKVTIEAIHTFSMNNFFNELQRKGIDVEAIDKFSVIDPNL